MSDGRAPAGQALLASLPKPEDGLRPPGNDPSRVNGLGQGKSNDWHTPPEVFRALNCQFDMDVAAPMLIPAYIGVRKWLWKDSLETEWEGFVWMNPPFGGRNGLGPWLTKFFDHGNGIALTPDRTSAPWFHASWARADAVMFTRKMSFLLPTGRKAGSPAFGTALWAAGPRGVAGLRHAHARGFGLLCFPCDSGRLPKGGDGTAPCEASQSGAAETAHRPTPSDKRFVQACTR